MQKFLTRDPKARLQDFDDIKNHPWFSSLDWEKLLKREIIPSFIPEVKSADDIGNIDKEFLDQRVDDEDEDDSNNAVVKPDTFGGFTFQSPV